MRTDAPSLRSVTPPLSYALRSAAGENPLEGYTPSIPRGYPLTIGTPEFLAYEAEGAAAAAAGAAFVLVAGGLGERLGYSGIKLSLPTDLIDGTCYLELYVRHILALQALSATGGQPQARR